MNLCLHELRIRNAVPGDAGQLAAWWNDGAVMAHAGFPLGLGVTPEAVERQIAAESDEERRTLIIEYGLRPIGEMSYRDRSGGTAEIGVKICEAAFQDKGLGRVLLSLFIRELFAMGYEKIVLDTNRDNLRAQHVYEMLGFRKLRVHVDSWKDQLGRPQSSVDYELLPADFRDLSAGRAKG